MFFCWLLYLYLILLDALKTKLFHFLDVTVILKDVPKFRVFMVLSILGLSCPYPRVTAHNSDHGGEEKERGSQI